MKPGTARFLLPHQIHKINSHPESPIRLFCCMFDLSILLDSFIDNPLYQVLLQSGDKLPSSVHLNESEKEVMQRLCKNIMDEYLSDQIGKDSSIRAKLIEALLIFIRSRHRIRVPQPVLNAGQTKQKDWELIRYMNTNYIKRLTLKDLSIKFDVSPSYISRLFKTQLNISFLDYLHTLRIKRAAALLTITEMPIYEISEEAGFESFRTFSRLFKKCYQMTPKQYRNEYRRSH